MKIVKFLQNLYEINFKSYINKRRGDISQIKMFNKNSSENKSYYMNFKLIL